MSASAGGGAGISGTSPTPACRRQPAHLAPLPAHLDRPVLCAAPGPITDELPERANVDSLMQLATPRQHRHLRCLCCRGPKTRGLAIEERSQPSPRPPVPQHNPKPAASLPWPARLTLARAGRTKSDTRSLERGVKLVTSLVRQITVGRACDPDQPSDRARPRPGGGQQPPSRRPDTLWTGSRRPDVARVGSQDCPGALGGRAQGVEADSGAGEWGRGRAGEVAPGQAAWGRGSWG